MRGPWQCIFILFYCSSLEKKWGIQFPDRVGPNWIKWLAQQVWGVHKQRHQFFLAIWPLHLPHHLLDLPLIYYYCLSSVFFPAPKRWRRHLWMNPMQNIKVPFSPNKSSSRGTRQWCLTKSKRITKYFIQSDLVFSTIRMNCNNIHLNSFLFLLMLLWIHAAENI